MKRATVLMVLVAGCGGDDTSARPDVLINPGPTYDLSCLNNVKTTVPTTITFDSTVFDHTGNTPSPVANATITMYSLADDAVLATSTSDMDGKAMVEIQTSGTPSRIYATVEATDFIKARHYVNIAPWTSGAATTIAMRPSRVTDIATALGVTPDPTKGTLEVWSNDCSSVGELPGASLQLDGADVQWAMYGGVGVWIPRATTLGTISTLRNGSVAGIANVTPGTHTVTVTAGSLSLTSTVGVEAGGWSVLVMAPGHPLN